MRNGVNISAAVCLLSLLLVGCSPTVQSVPDSRETDVEAIRRADLAWVQAQAADGLDGTMSFYLEDGIMLPPDSPMAIGKPAIREASAALGIGAPGSFGNLAAYKDRGRPLWGNRVCDWDVRGILPR